MKVTENTNIKCYTITNLQTFNPITYVLHKINSKSGTLIVEYQGEAWSAYFNYIGTDSFEDFIIKNNPEYIVGIMKPIYTNKSDIEYLTRIIKAIQTSIPLIAFNSL